jgi:hypothetical protein
MLKAMDVITRQELPQAPCLREFVFRQHPADLAISAFWVMLAKFKERLNKNGSLYKNP